MQSAEQRPEIPTGEELDLSPLALAPEETPPEASVQKPKKSAFILPYLLLAIFVLTLLPGPLFLIGLIAKGPLESATVVVIPRGAGVREIGKILEDKKAIIHPLFFLAATRLVSGGPPKAGEYEIAPGLSALDVAAILSQGRTLKRQFTVPEGLTSREVSAILDKVEGLDGTLEAMPEEGALLPETYFYILNNTRAEIVARMKKDMTDLVNGLWEKRQAGLPFQTPREAVILASIVEKETGRRAEERARVAGVFLNRLRHGMPLQSDPTVIYAVTKGAKALERPLTLKDLETASPYNTYQNAGLPPGPICNPGRAALEAVLNPEKNDYLYFVADGTGGHAFARTLDEHNRNVARWRALNR